MAIMHTPRIDLRPGVTELVVLMFSRREVEASDPGPAVARLNTLFNSREAIWRYRGQVALVVDGYDDDPRELVDVSEVRTFLARFTQAWPYWAYYFNQVDDSIKLLAACLCARRLLGAGHLEIDPDKLGVFLADGFAAMNTVFDEHGFPESELQNITEGVIEVITQAGMG
jgi:hypothetical protein